MANYDKELYDDDVHKAHGILLSAAVFFPEEVIKILWGIEDEIIA